MSHKGKSSYENHAIKLDRKDNQFNSKKFFHVRKESTRKKTLRSLESIGTCLNDLSTIDIQTANFDKVCFILINDYEKELGVGPFNDSYLIGLTHRKHGYKVFYLYNSLYLEFLSYLWFFLQKTQVSLTIFYTGINKKCQGIEFADGMLTKTSIGDEISSHCTGKAKIVFITDSLNGGSVFSIQDCKNLISFSVKKDSIDESNRNKRSHGILTYYLYKIINDCPNITPNELENKINPQLERFNEVLVCETNNKKYRDMPILQ